MEQWPGGDDWMVSGGWRGWTSLYLVGGVVDSRTHTVKGLGGFIVLVRMEMASM